MSAARRALCGAYGAIALVALFACWGHNAAYFGAPGESSWSLWNGNVAFWRDTLANSASTSITLDILFFGLAASIWMVAEGRRTGVRFAWLYVVLGGVVAISVTFPLFLIARERGLAHEDGARGAPLRAWEVLLFAASAAVLCFLTVRTFLS